MFRVGTRVLRATGGDLIWCSGSHFVFIVLHGGLLVSDFLLSWRSQYDILWRDLIGLGLVEFIPLPFILAAVLTRPARAAARHWFGGNLLPAGCRGPWGTNLGPACPTAAVELHSLYPSLTHPEQFNETTMLLGL